MASNLPLPALISLLGAGAKSLCLNNLNGFQPTFLHIELDRLVDPISVNSILVKTNELVANIDMYRYIDTSLLINHVC